MLTTVLLDEPDPAEQGTFRIKLVTPNEFTVDNSRDVDRVIVTFEGGTIDCAATSHGIDGFHLSSATVGMQWQQSMYEDPAQPNPGRGSGPTRRWPGPSPRRGSHADAMPASHSPPCGSSIRACLD